MLNVNNALINGTISEDLIDNPLKSGSDVMTLSIYSRPY